MSLLQRLNAESDRELYTIAATRNAGARQARGDILFFVDADTLVNAAAIQPAACCAG